MTTPLPSESPTRRVWRDPAVLLATCGGLGEIPVAPGTFGALAGLLAATALAHGGLPRGAEVLILTAVNLLGVVACGRATRLLGRGEDPGAIVLDEAASLPLALLVVPCASRSPAILAAAFVLHRLFDISKPFPCRRLEHLPGGLGIMADDWGAAAYTASCLAIGRWLGWL